MLEGEQQRKREMRPIREDSLKAARFQINPLISGLIGIVLYAGNRFLWRLSLQFARMRLVLKIIRKENRPERG
jgi:hypothetical protein|tara:strand:- start:30669 stop:30887 length:219 start_codon:yes stop_codon:yes gene_type:complete